MDEIRLEEVFNLKRKYFDDGHTRSYDFRIGQLKKLKAMLKNNEDKILEALKKDLNKPAFEAYTSEVGILYEEINYAVRNLRSWMKEQRVSTPISISPSRSYIYSEPLGVVLIISPWNYPVQLLLAPLIGAIAAGNCAILKPSDQAKHSSDLITKLIGETFGEDYISVVQGPGSMVGPMLIEKFRFDHIFFTGSPTVGKSIASMAGNKLTPVTLELGGKSPAIVEKDAHIDSSAKRLVWGKFFNAGQTCVCPDYLLIHEDIKEEFINRMIYYIGEFFGSNPIESNSFGRIINKKRFDILCGYLSEGKILFGGDIDRESLYISPTLIENVTSSCKIMQEEIFGPILPVLTFKDRQEALMIIRRNRYPLALYVFTQDKNSEQFYIDRVEFGGGGINNCIVHLANTKLPFGGVGYSGMGSYHGKYSFDVFSHRKSIVKSSLFKEPEIKYAPYSIKKLNLAKKLLK